MKKYNVIEDNITYSVEEDADGDKHWYLNNQLHRVNGPAIELANGSKQWFLNGNFHRIDGPAIEWTNGTKHWYLNDKLHRVNSPAIEFANGDKFWYYHGTKVLCKNLKEFNRQIKLLSIS